MPAPQPAAATRPATSCFVLLVAPDALERRHAAPRPSPTLPCLSLVCSLPPEHHRAELVAAAHRLRSHSLPLASPTRAEAPPRLPRLLRQATRRWTPCGAAVAIVFLLGRRRPPTPIRRLQCVPEPASTPAATAVSSATVPLSPFSCPHAVALLPTTAEASRRRPCRRRRLGPPPPKPSTPSCSRCHEGAAEPLRWPPRAPQPVSARSQTPAAAPSFALASSGVPAASRLLPWMRTSPGYAPVLSDAVPVACGADSAASRGRRRRAPSPEPRHVGPARQVISLVLITA